MQYIWTISPFKGHLVLKARADMLGSRVAVQEGTLLFDNK